MWSEAEASWVMVEATRGERRRGLRETRLEVKMSRAAADRLSSKGQRTEAIDAAGERPASPVGRLREVDVKRERMRK